MVEERRNSDKLFHYQERSLTIYLKSSDRYDHQIINKYPLLGAKLDL